MHFKTKAIHAGLNVENNSKAVIPPIQPSTVFENDKQGFQEGDLHYSRHANPNRLQWEHLLTELEGGEATAAFASGVAAATAIFQSLKPDDHIILPYDVYAGNRDLVENVMQPWNLQADFVGMTDPAKIEQAITKNTKLIWIETPSNPLLNITDIKTVCNIAQQYNILVCVDNTWPTPVNQLPLELGADLVLHSTTKYFGGHSDILGGSVTAGPSASAFFERIREIQLTTGAVPSPRDCWMLSRSTRTLSYRMKGHNEHALELAQFLDNHPVVETVFYPGLQSHPGHDVAKEQMSHFGGMISFLVDGGREKSLNIVAASQLISRATSLGGVESTWEHRRSSEGEGSNAPENLIRISVGLEHIDDLKEDLRQALK